MKIIKIIGKTVWGIFLVLILSIVIYLNCGLYYSPCFEKVEKDEVNVDVLYQLRFLKTEMHKGAADEMQSYFPEGFIFMNALYGLSWSELVKKIDKDSELFKEAHKEIQFSYNEINSEKGTRIFPRQLELPYGAFYIGWNNYLLGKKLAIEKPEDRDSSEIKLYEASCARISDVIDSSASPYPESYAGFSWPADVSVCIACLANHDKIFQQKYSSAIKQWIQKVKRLADPDGLMPHSFDPATLQVKENARGCSQSLIQNFLFEIDSTFGKEQFTTYKKLFLDARVGLPGIREYKKGNESEGDVDSGPVIFGIGGSASIVGLRAMGLMKENETAIGLRNSIETFGFSLESEKQKKYLFGELPMADAFICWANSTEINSATKLSTNKYWLGNFQLYSLCVLLPVLYFLWRLVRLSKKEFSPKV
ncbi:MAG: hypothetical protein IAF38_18695 [Bacteroidia bacterium]|nr:hypothetical protein [Bacteroidia bacterium]